MLYPPSALSILCINLVSEERKENGRVGSDSKYGNAAVENHKDILMDKREPAIDFEFKVLLIFCYLVLINLIL